jgi:hypothetical protein
MIHRSLIANGRLRPQRLLRFDPASRTDERHANALATVLYLPRSKAWLEIAGNGGWRKSNSIADKNALIRDLTPEELDGFADAGKALESASDPWSYYARFLPNDCPGPKRNAARISRVFRQQRESHQEALRAWNEGYLFLSFKLLSRR